MTLFVRAAAVITLSAAFAGPPAQAASVNAFTSFWSLGDSLSDNGNLYAATANAPGGPTPASPPYYQGRFSNGPVWAEYVAADFQAKGLATGNFAYGFARALPDADLVPDLATQIGLFAKGSAGALGDRPVVSLWIGANDLIFNGIPTGEAAAIGREAATAVATGALALSGLGVHDVALFTLPDLGSVPLYALAGNPAAREQASAGSRAFNETLAEQIPKLEKAGLNVIEIDTAGLFQALLDDPEAFGVGNATIPCFVPASGQPPCAPDVAERLAFFDPIHPNSVIHAGIADVVEAEISPVPLPLPAALLLAALAGLGLINRRRLL